MTKIEQKIPEGWSVKKLGDCCSMSSGGTPSKSNSDFWNGDIPWISASAMRGIYFSSSEEKITELGLQKGSRSVNKGDLLLLVRGSMLWNYIPIGIATRKLAFNQDVKGISVKNNITNQFLLYWFKTNEHLIKNMVVGTGIGAGKLDTQELNNIKILLPPLPEQEKIAGILSCWDDGIEKLSALIEKKKIQKKALMQQLLTGKHRLKGFSTPWHEVKLGDILHENNERAIMQNQHTVLSVTKNGICSQSEYFDKQIASENNIGYKVLHKYNVVFSPMNLWMGSLGFSEYDVGIVSPAYKIFTINPQYGVFNFLKYFMICPKMINLYAVNSEMGASVVRRNLDLQSLLSSKIVIPDLAEQRAIAEILSKADEEIELLNKKLEAFKQEKKALMQQLLTGKIRVKVN